MTSLRYDISALHGKGTIFVGYWSDRAAAIIRLTLHLPFRVIHIIASMD